MSPDATANTKTEEETTFHNFSLGKYCKGAWSHNTMTPKEKQITRDTLLYL